jgi:hypothetical protein
MSHTFPLHGPIDLLGRIGHGSFTVDCRDDVTEAIVTLDGAASAVDRITVELRGSTLTVTAPREGGIFDLARGGRRDAVAVTVTVPSGTPVKVTTHTAAIALTGRCGSADLASGSAVITAEDVDGDLRLRYGSGSARVERVRGAVQRKSGSGHASFGEVDGPLMSACGSGDLTVTTARGPVRSRTGSGSAVLSAVYGDVDVASGSGPLTVGVPTGTAVQLDVTSGSGRVHSELPIDSARTSSTHAIKVRARTGSGEVRFISAA